MKAKITQAPIVGHHQHLLVLAPHTDDGELGCGGTIARFIEQGCTVTYVAFSTAEQSLPPGMPPGTLKQEVSAATGRLGIEKSNLIVFEYEVRKLNYVRQEILEDLVRIKRERAVDLVLMPSLNDIHQDHSTVAIEGLRAFKDRTILGYELIWNNLTFNTACFVRLERRHIQRKADALTCYKSQAGKAYASEEFIFSLARTRGVQIGADFAECFETVRWVI
jgi:LmbE family N-acetylglucosaminyl deacetylase